MKSKSLPELLSPAGSKDAFFAAVDGGADAIYLGGTSFNARINAKNFTREELSDCVRLAHTYGVKVYTTLNTLLFDKEKEGFLACAEEMADCGIDAFIVADLGAARLLCAHMPEMELHASTQMSAHNASAGIALQKMGFSRLVPARELSFEDIKTLVSENPLEVEIFTHGALCVSHSGQCLFSSIVGGRSGNRGLCAQPCRLPYSCSGCSTGNGYPLSLKDLSLAPHVTKILDSGVHSLKIEGRMKSPEYVRGVTSIWRTLLDEQRNATPQEMQRLADIFSRGGFTDGYFTRNINKKMLGVRSQSDKEASLTTDKFTKITRKLPIQMSVSLKANTPCTLTLNYKNITVAAEGDIPMQAINAPLDKESIRRSISKLGDTPFVTEDIVISLDEGLMLPISRLNSLRRAAVEKLISALTDKHIPALQKADLSLSENNRKTQKIGRFLFASQITDMAREYFGKTFLPLERYDSRADGFIMPPVIFDSEKALIEKLIDKAIEQGASCAMVGNIGNISLLENKGLEIFGDFRFNVTNSHSVAFIEDLGVSNITLSPELTLPQIRDIRGDVSAIVYGRLPLMTLEKCVIRDLYGCENCDKYMSCRERGENIKHIEIKDRRGFNFPVIREWQHRNVIYNSSPTYMADKQSDLVKAKITNQVFMFTTESAQEVNDIIRRYKNQLAADGQIRRI